MIHEGENDLIFNNIDENLEELTKYLLALIKSDEWDKFTDIFQSKEEKLSGANISDILHGLLSYDQPDLSNILGKNLYDEIRGLDCQFDKSRAIGLLHKLKKDFLSKEEFIELLFNSLITKEGSLDIYTDLSIDRNVPRRIIEIRNLINSNYQKQYWSKEEITKILDNFWQGDNYKFSEKSMILSEKFKEIYIISEAKMSKNQIFDLIKLAIDLNYVDIIKYLYDRNENLSNGEKLKSETIELLKKIWLNSDTKNIFIKKFIFSKAKKYLSLDIKRELFFGVKLESLEMQFLVEEMPSFLYEADNGQKLLNIRLQKGKGLNFEEARSVKLVHVMAKIIRSELAPKFIQHLFNTMPGLTEIKSSEISINIKRNSPASIRFSLNMIGVEAKLEYIKLLIINNFDVDETCDIEEPKIITKRPLFCYFLKKIVQIKSKSIFKIISREELYEKAKLLALCTQIEFGIIKSVSNLIELNKEREIGFPDWVNNKLSKFVEDKGKKDSEYRKVEKSLKDYHAKLIRKTMKDIAPSFIKDIIQTISLIDKRFGLEEGMTIIVTTITGYIISEKFKPKLSEYLSFEGLKNIIDGVCIEVYLKQIGINYNAFQKIKQAKNRALIIEAPETENSSNNNRVKRKLSNQSSNDKINNKLLR